MPLICHTSLHFLLKRKSSIFVALHQEEFPFDLYERGAKLPVMSERIVMVAGIRRCAINFYMDIRKRVCFSVGGIPFDIRIYR